MMVDYVLGIDLGTTACKATLLSLDGALWTVESEPYPTTYPQEGWVEQDPQDWWRAIGETVKKVTQIAGCQGREIRSLGLTGQMHGLILLDKNGEMLRPAMLWSDHRASEQCRWILEQVQEIETITCNSLLPAFTLPKLIWVRDCEIDTYKKINRILLPKDYLRYRLTGGFLTEPSDASGTSMYDVRNFAWSSQILSALNIPLDWLPDCVPSTAVTGRLIKSAADHLGLVPGIPVVGGGADQAAQAIAMGVTQPGILGLTIGTSGVIVMTRTSPVQGSFCHAVDLHWLQLNSMHSAGLSLNWYRDAFHPQLSYSELESMARRGAPGSENLLFLPFLLGERQSARPSVPAGFIGIRPGHEPSHFVRAVYEGIAFEFRRMVQNWLDSGLQVGEVRFSGGGSKSNLWGLILANLLNLPVMKVDQGASFGTAILAGIAAGWWESVEGGIETHLQIAQVQEPTALLSHRYNEFFDRYRNLYEILSGNIEGH